MATSRWYSRGSTFIALTCISLILIFSNDVESSSSDESSFVRRDSDASATSSNVRGSFTSISSSNSTTIASQTSNTSTSTPSSTQSLSTVVSSSTPISLNTTRSIAIASSFGTNSTSSGSLSISTSLFLQTTTFVVTPSAESSSSSSPTLVYATPSITFVLNSDILPTSSSTVPSISPTSSSVSAAASRSSFWKNKAAIVAVFVIVALIACGVIVVSFIAFVKRRNARRAREQSFLLDRHTDTSPTYSTDPSVNSAPMDTFSTREVVPFFQPMALSTLQHTTYSNQHCVPHSLQQSTSGPPVSYGRVKRKSAQPSIDSFYGAPAT